jgi:regulation of enolase protein 1 (concanavalin A-like superfamily)
MPRADAGPESAPIQQAPIEPVPIESGVSEAAAAEGLAAAGLAAADRVRVDWTVGTWTHRPADVRRDGNALVVRAVQGSDFWRSTHYGFVHDDGHALLTEWPARAAVEVSFDASTLTELYDQAGLMLRVGPDRWIKAGVELNDGVPHVGAVVTDGRSDWSLAPVPDWAGEIVTIRASRAPDSVVLRARAGRGAWRTIRVAPFAELPATAWAGPMICSPTRDGLEVRFTGWSWTEPDTSLHDDPPA